MAVTENLIGLDPQQQREDVGEVAKDHEQDIGAISAGNAGGVLYLGRAARMAPARIGLIVGQQRHDQIQAQRAKSDQCTFLEPVVQVLPPERNGGGCYGGFLQNASIPARKREHLMIDCVRLP